MKSIAVVEYVLLETAHSQYGIKVVLQIKISKSGWIEKACQIFGRELIDRSDNTNDSLERW